MKYFLTFVLFCLAQVFSFSQGGRGESDLSIDIISKYINSSDTFNFRVHSSFVGKGKQVRNQHHFIRVSSNDSLQKECLYTGLLPDSVKQNIIRFKKNEHFVCKVSPVNNMFVCEVYHVTTKTFRHNPVIFCEFRMFCKVDIQNNTVTDVRFELKELL